MYKGKDQVTVSSNAMTSAAAQTCGYPAGGYLAAAFQLSPASSSARSAVISMLCRRVAN